MGNSKTWEQYKLECDAAAKEGITVLGFVEPWAGNNTKLICNCEKHGKWQTTSISHFKGGTSCPKCKNEKVGLRGKSFLTGNQHTLKDDSFHIKGFMKTGGFHPKTKFFRSERSTAAGGKAYWNYICPICSVDEYVKNGVCTGLFEAYSGSLKKGDLSCRCSRQYRYTKGQWEYRLKKECKERGYEFLGCKTEKFGSKSKFIYLCPIHGKQTITPSNFFKGRGCAQCAGQNQKECYINIIYDEHLAVALKFGISNKSKARLRGQNGRNLFQMKQMQVYQFCSVEDCKAAERTCLSEIDCGILSSRELQDGYTETTSLQNLDKIIEIYERFGGVRFK